MTADPVRALQDRLLRELPVLEVWLGKARDENEEEPQSEYWLFSYVVRPCLETLLTMGSEGELVQAWKVLERIAATGPAAAKNELFVMIEELDLWRHYRLMGPTLREHWLEALIWYPTRRTRSEAINTHVDPRRFRERWIEEIERIGGFEQLTADRERRIAGDLWREFRVRDPFREPLGRPPGACPVRG
jgi:hypothetical protein